MLSALASALYFTTAGAADLTLYYSPSCPHCHHARDFINNELVYEYPNISVDMLNLGQGDNITAFRAALEKCEYKSGGVPVIVANGKCFQGYADFMKDDLRAAVSANMSDADKTTADANRKAMAADPEKFRADHAASKGKITERIDGDQKKK